MCLDFGTISNEGFPFTYDLTAPDTDLQPIAVAQNETLELQNGVSRITDSRRCDAKSDPWPPRCAHTSGGHPPIQCQLCIVPLSFEFLQIADLPQTLQNASYWSGNQFTQFNCTDS
jgi:hypothetical protein